MAARDRHSEISRGRQAAGEYRELEAAFAAVDEALVAELRKCPVGADARILKLHVALQNLKGVREALLKTIANGKHAEAALEAVADGFGGPDDADD